MGNRGRPRHPDILTPREWEVLELLRAGLTNEQIASRLDVSPATAKYHVSEILSKLGVETREQAAAWQPAAEERRWTPGRWAIAGLGATIVVAVLVTLGLLAWDAGDDDEDDRAVAATATSRSAVPATPTPLPTLDPMVTPAPSFGPAFTPESLSGRQYVPGLYVTAAEGDEPEALYTGRVGFASWSALSVSSDGRWLVTQLPGGSGILVFDLNIGREPTRLEFDEGFAIAAIAAGSGRIASEGTVNGVQGLYLMEPDGTDATLVPLEPGYVGSLAWSPDGSQLAFDYSLDDGSASVRVVDASGGGQRVLASDAVGPVWSPDGSMIAMSQRSTTAFMVLNASGGETLRVPNWYAQDYVWHPTGRQITYTDYLSVAEDPVPVIRSRDIFTGEESLIADGSRPKWSEDGAGLAFERDGQVFALDVSTGSELQLSDARQPFAGWPTWLPGGRIIFAYQPGFQTAIYIANADGTSERRIAEGRDPAWSPDGESIAFEGWTTGPGLGGENHIYTMRDDGSDMRRIGGYNWSDVGGSCLGFGTSRWSYDSRYVAMEFGQHTAVVSGFGIDAPRALPGCPAAWSPKENNLATLAACSPTDPYRPTCLFINDIDTGEVQRYGRAEVGVAFSPDGRSLAFARDESVWAIDIETGEEEQIAQFDKDFLLEILWSPDGQWVVVNSDTAVAVNVDTGVQTLVGGGHAQAISPAGQVALSVYGIEGAELRIIDIESGEISLVLPAYDLDWSPDGTRIVYSRVE